MLSEALVAAEKDSKWTISGFFYNLATENLYTVLLVLILILIIILF